MHVAWLAAAHHANPLQLIKAVSYTGGNLGSEDEEGADTSQSAAVQMASGGGSPDVEQEADAAGKSPMSVRHNARCARVPVAPPPRPRNFFERIFGAHPRPAASAAPTPPPTRRARPAF